MEKHILIVRFISGTVYHYLQVPERIYQAFRRAASKGTYLNRHVKGKYSYRKIEP